MLDVAQNFIAYPRKAPRTCPAQPPANIPGASGNMYPPEKHLRNEKLKALKAESERILDKLVDPKSNLRCALIQTQFILIDLMEAMMEPEEPG